MDDAASRSEGVANGVKRLSRWSLTEAALDRLLEHLDADREVAGARYEALRRRLASLFRWWGCEENHELVDRTIDRIAIKLEEGAAVVPQALPAFVRGVARLVFLEWTREQAREQAVARDVPKYIASDPGQHEALGFLDRCLDMVAIPDRELILRYYGANDDSAIAGRKRLAGELSLSPTALRIRAHRLRQRLQECVMAAMRRRER